MLICKITVSISIDIKIKEIIRIIISLMKIIYLCSKIAQIFNW